MGQRAQDSAALVVELTGADQQAVTGACVFLGYEVDDDASSSAHVHFHDGTSSSGVLIGVADPPNGGHESNWYGPGGIKVTTGLFVSVENGTPGGCVYYR